MCLSLVVTGSLVALAIPLSAGDWPQYRGPRGDGISAEKLALRRWPAQGLPTLWKAPTPTGFSCFAVADGKVFTLVKRNLEGADREVCVALDARTGQELWAVPFSTARYDGGGDSGGGGDGPRSTPTWNDGLVYVLDSRLVLGCIDGASGRIVWKKDLVKEHGGKVIQWQSAASPLVEGQLVFVAAGGAGQSLLGLDKKTGQAIWKAESDAITHATPVAATILGQPQVIFFTQKGLVSVKPETGAVLWRYGFPYSVSTAASPVVCGDLVYCSAGYGVGAGLCKISRSETGLTATEVWRKPNKPVNHWSTPVFKDGYLYGMFSFKEFGKGHLKCVELATGNEMWTQPDFGPGNVLLVDGLLLALGDRGQLVLVEATPTGYTEVSRMQAVGGKCWSTAAYSNGRIYLRSTTEGACLDASGK